MNISISVKRDVAMWYRILTPLAWFEALSYDQNSHDILYNTILCRSSIIKYTSTSLGGPTPPRSGMHCNNKPTAAFETCR